LYDQLDKYCQIEVRKAFIKDLKVRRAIFYFIPYPCMGPKGIPISKVGTDGAGGMLKMREPKSLPWMKTVQWHSLYPKKGLK
jgi:hypothetical protein